MNNYKGSVRNFIVENDVIRTKVEGFVKGFEIPEGGIHYMSDGSVEVEVKIPLSGLLSAAPELLFGRTTAGNVCPTCGQPWPAGKPGPSNVFCRLTWPWPWHLKTKLKSCRSRTS